MPPERLRSRPSFPVALPTFPGPGGWGLPTVLDAFLLRRRRRLLFRGGGGGGGGWSAWPVPEEGAAGSAGDSTAWEPSAGACVYAIELLIHRKKGGGRERKTRSHMSGLYGCGEKQRKEGGKKMKASRRRRRKRKRRQKRRREAAAAAAGDRHPPV